MYKLDYPSDSYDGTVGRIITDLDTVLFIAGMHDSASAHINSHMTGITDDIARLSFGIRYAHAAPSHRRRGVGQTDTKVSIYRFDKSGTVGAVCQARSTPDIGITHKLCSVRYN